MIAIVEISSRVFTLEQLKKTSIEFFDAFYLGDPFAPEYDGNLSFSFDNLEKAILELTAAGKRVYVSTFSVPRNRDLPAIENLVMFILEKKLPIQAFEAHNTGAMKVIHEIAPNIPIHMGCLSNIYTDSTVNLLKQYGVKRVVPNYELSLDEIEIIKDRCNIEVEVLIHGRMILGVSEECPAKWWIADGHRMPENGKWIGENYFSYCMQIIDLISDKMALTVRGRVTMSGKDVCMLEHIPHLLQKGFRYFHIDSSVGGADYINRAGECYRRAISEWKNNEGDRKEWDRLIRQFFAELKNFNTRGFCNGYYFKTSGADYVGEWDSLP